MAITFKDLLPGYILGGLFYVACLGIAGMSSIPVLNVLLCLLAGGLGWALGLVFTSLTTSSNMKKISQWVLAGVAGLSLGKLDDISSSDFVSGIIPTTYDQVISVVLVAICLIVGLLVTSVWCNFKRREGDAANRSASVEKIKELADTLK